jgi:adenylosuccinate synthase
MSLDFQNKYNQAKERHFKIINTYDFDPALLKIEGMEFAEYERLWLESIEEIKKITFIDSEIYIHKAMKEGKTILAEGAQGTLLDIDFGSYPFVTSSNTITAAVCTGLGLAPNNIGRVFGVFKAYCTRVGSGPFPTELDCEVGEKLRKNGHEFGSTTGRPRRCGWLDLPALKYSIMINGVTDLIITKADVMDDFEEIKVCTHYDFQGEKLDYLPFEISQKDIKPVYQIRKGWKVNLPEISELNNLPGDFKSYLTYIETEVETPITVISLGPDRSQTIDLTKL